MENRLQTPRGVYLLTVVGEPEQSDSAVVITLNLERADGIERLRFRCAIGGTTDAAAADADAIAERLAPWIERQFEQLREAALKSVRSEHKLLQVEFHPTDDPG